MNNLVLRTKTVVVDVPDDFEPGRGPAAPHASKSLSAIGRASLPTIHILGCGGVCRGLLLIGNALPPAFVLLPSNGTARPDDQPLYDRLWST